MKDYEVFQLDNGLRVISSRMPGMESVAIGIWVGVGGRFEDKRVQGISHFVEHLLFKGTENRTSQEISSAIEGVGGHINAYTSEEHTCYMAKVRGKHQGLALDVLGDMINYPLFDPNEIEKERYVIMEEIHMILDNPNQFVGELIHQLLWPDHPLGRMLVGTEESVNSIRREDILEFWRKNYSPQNILVSSAGNVDLDRLLEDTKRYIKGTSEKGLPKMETFKPIQKSAQVKIVNRQTEQIHVCVGIRSVPREDPDRYIVKLLSIILGENMSSRLFQIIREKHGLCYDISSGVSYFKDTGGFVISSGVKLGMLEKFLELVLGELRKIKADGVGDKELTMAKEFYEGQLTLEFEKTMSRMLWLGENLINTGKVPTISDVLSNVQRVSLEDIQRVANRIFNVDNLSIAVIGPIKEDERLEIGL